MADRSASFSRYLQRWWERQLGDPTGHVSRLGGRDAHAIAVEFRKDAQFEISQARFLLRRPNESIAQAVVSTLAPTPTAEDADLLVAAIVRAGATAQRVRVTTAASAGLTVVALVTRSVLRRR